MLRDEVLADVTQMVWVVMDRGHSRYGEIEPNEIIDSAQTAVVFEVKGVAVLDGGEVLVALMTAAEAAELRKDTQPADQDMRVLGVHLDKSGRRRLDLDDAVLLMDEKMDD